jgi:hypothetical protein
MHRLENVKFVAWVLITELFLGALAQLRKATISFVMSVCPSVCTEELCSHWNGFHEIWYLSVFLKSVRKIQVSLKTDKNNFTVHENLCTLMIISHSILLRMRNSSDKFVEKIKEAFCFEVFHSVHFLISICSVLCSVTFFYIVPFMR